MPWATREYLALEYHKWVRYCTREITDYQLDRAGANCRLRNIVQNLCVTHGRSFNSRIYQRLCIYKIILIYSSGYIYVELDVYHADVSHCTCVTRKTHIELCGTMKYFDICNIPQSFSLLSLFLSLWKR